MNEHLGEYLYETDSGKTCYVKLYDNEVDYVEIKPNVHNLRSDDT